MNAAMETVRDPAAGRSLDRRVRRTRAALTRALVDLVLAKRYRSITVQDLLDRADVGRSTFYSHYRGKDDLLLRSFEAMLEVLDACLDDDAPEAGRLAPVEELFRHVGGFRDFHRALVRARRIDLLFDVDEALSGAGPCRAAQQQDPDPREPGGLAEGDDREAVEVEPEVARDERGRDRGADD